MSTTSQTRRAIGAPVGPRSLLWQTAGDPRSLLTGMSAGLMQLMLPHLGAGVTEHSDFFDDPFDRIWRSIPPIWGTIFATDDDEGDTQGRYIRDLHRDIKGVDEHGKRYHALDPDVYWWAHATFTWEMLRARELYWPVPLRRSEKERLYAETITWYRRYGVSDRPVPPDLQSFEARFDQICREELELTPAVVWALDPNANPASRPAAVRLPGPLAPLGPVVSGALGDVMRLLVYGGLPDVVRRRFGFRWTHADRVAFAGLASALRSSGPAVQRGALSGLWPEGTPHLAPGTNDRVIIAGPSIGQRRAAAAAAR